MTENRYYWGRENPRNQWKEKCQQWEDRVLEAQKRVEHLLEQKRQGNLSPLQELELEVWAKEVASLYDVPRLPDPINPPEPTMKPWLK